MEWILLYLFYYSYFKIVFFYVSAVYKTYTIYLKIFILFSCILNSILKYSSFCNIL